MSIEFLQRMVTTYARVHSDRYWEAIDNHIDADFIRNGVVADLGCGPGLLLRDLGKRFKPSKLIGVDLSPIMLDRAQSETAELGIESRFIQQHLQDNPNLTFKANAIFSSRVLRSFEDQATIMRSIHNALEKGGYLVITDWTRSSIPEYEAWFQQQKNEFEEVSPEDVIRFHRMFSRYHIEDWVYILENFGFEVLTTSQIDAVHACVIGKKLNT